MASRILRALVAFVALLGAGCHHHKPAAPNVEGAWLDAGGSLLLVVDASGVATFYYVAGMGSCIDQLVDATVSGTTLETPSGKSIPLSVSGNTLTIQDPSGSIGGAYTRVDYATICYFVVPPPGAASARATTLEPTPKVPVAGGASRTVTFTIPPGAVSFSLDIFGQDVGFDGIVIDVLTPPSGGNLLVREPALEECFNGYCGVFLPKSPKYPPEAGTYTALIEGPGAIDDGSLSVRLVVRPGPYVTPTTLRVHPVVGPTSSTDAELATALAGMKSFLEARGLTITIDPLTKLADPRFQRPVADFLNPVTAELMSHGATDAVNLFFCDDLVGLDGLFGQASGIPGSLGIVGPWNGVLVNLAQHRTGAGLSNTLLVETIVHEPGHLLGLYHTTESDGRVFDILDDTPECTARIYDVDRDGYVLADECISVDGHNVMFWTPSTSDGSVVVQDVTSTDQIGVLSHSVIGE